MNLQFFQLIGSMFVNPPCCPKEDVDSVMIRPNILEKFVLLEIEKRETCESLKQRKELENEINQKEISANIAQNVMKMAQALSSLASKKLELAKIRKNRFLQSRKSIIGVPINESSENHMIEKKESECTNKFLENSRCNDKSEEHAKKSKN